MFVSSAPSTPAATSSPSFVISSSRHSCHVASESWRTLVDQLCVLIANRSPLVDLRADDRARVHVSYETVTVDRRPRSTAEPGGAVEPARDAVVARGALATARAAVARARTAGRGGTSSAGRRARADGAG